MKINHTNTFKFIDKFWNDSAIPCLKEFVKIPSITIDLDQDWKKHGNLHRALKLFASWAKKQNVPGLTSKIIELKNRTPILLIEIPGTTKEAVLFYGHADKIPATTDWDKGLHPWKAVIRENKIYGRGTNDDGYSLPTAIASVKALHEQKIPLPHTFFFIECAEESGSPDCMAYLEMFKNRFRDLKLVIVIDSEGPSHDHLWRTVSMRGHLLGNLKVTVLNSGTQSGNAGNIVPSSFRIVRNLLERIEDGKSGKVLMASTKVKMPKDHLAAAKKIVKLMGKKIYSDFPWADKVEPMTKNLTKLLQQFTWEPCLAVLGADGLPPIKEAGNVLRPFTKLKLSLRLPPTVDTKKVFKELKQKLETNPPYNAKVEFEVKSQIRQPWFAKNIGSSWLSKSLNEAGKAFYGKECANLGIGASIGVVAHFASLFPNAEILVTGINTPDGGAHGPNEYLHIPTVKKFTCCITKVLADFSDNFGSNKKNSH